MEKIHQLIERFKSNRGPLTGLLQDISAEYGYLPEETLREVSSEIEVPLSQLYALATFYASFRLEPLGKHHICVCVGTACHVKGALKIADSLERELKIKAGQTTEDGEYSFETLNCLGACALSPLVVVDGEYHGKMDQKKMTKLVKETKENSQA